MKSMENMERFVDLGWVRMIREIEKLKRDVR
jgi:hypothetical protein